MPNWLLSDDVIPRIMKHTKGISDALAGVTKCFEVMARLESSAAKYVEAIERITMLPDRPPAR